MPLFPQGGGLYPDSIDNSLLADMAAGTVKGRPVGGGLGNPEDLTGAQLSAILAAASGAATYGNCRLDYVSTSIVRLNRCNGCILTIDNTPQVIPVAGVDLSNAALASATLYNVYAYMNASGVMTLEASATAGTVDPRNGMWVKTGDPARALVGMVYLVGGVFTMSQTRVLVTSYYNRRRTSGVLALNASSSSGTPTLWQDTIQFLSWGTGHSPSFAGYGHGVINNNIHNEVQMNGAGNNSFVVTTLVNTGWFYNMSSVNRYLSVAGYNYTNLVGWCSGGSLTMTGTLTVDVDI